MFVLSLLLINGCGAAHYKNYRQRDSLSSEVRTLYIERIDTVYVQLPRSVERLTTRDTTSLLENSFSLSVASIMPNGCLYHTLETKPEKVPVSVTSKETQRDSIIYRDRAVYVDRPIEVVELASKFVKFEIRGF